MKATASMAPSSPAAFHQSPWHTPVPYFFGGLALVMGLIAFALLMLACSYLNDHAADDDVENPGERDLEAGESKPDNINQCKFPVLEEKYVVIMAGKAAPTFLATPIGSRASSFGGCSCRSNSTAKSSDEVTAEKENAESGDHLQVRNQESVDQAFVVTEGYPQ